MSSGIGGLAVARWSMSLNVSKTSTWWRPETYSSLFVIRTRAQNVSLPMFESKPRVAILSDASSKYIPNRYATVKRISKQFIDNYRLIHQKNKSWQNIDSHLSISDVSVVKRCSVMYHFRQTRRTSSHLFHVFVFVVFFHFCCSKVSTSCCSVSLPGALYLNDIGKQIWLKP